MGSKHVASPGTWGVGQFLGHDGGGVIGWSRGGGCRGRWDGKGRWGGGPVPVVSVLFSVGEPVNG